MRTHKKIAGATAALDDDAGDGAENNSMDEDVGEEMEEEMGEKEEGRSPTPVMFLDQTGEVRVFNGTETIDE